MDGSQIQYMPGDPRLVDQLVCELKSKGIFDQFRKECIADVDTRPAYQNLRQRVENSVSLFLSRQTWRPDLNKNQLREKLRKHILDGNYLEQGVERIVDQVVNPKVASIFIPQVEDLVYNYLGIPKKRNVPDSAANGNDGNANLLPTDLEAVSPGSVKSSNETNETEKMEIDEAKPDSEEVTVDIVDENKENIQIDKDPESQMSGVIDLTSRDSVMSIDKSTIPLPTEGIKLENIPLPKNSPPQVEIENIELPKDPYPITNIPLPDEIAPQSQNYPYFKPPNNSESEDSESDSSLIRNMSPLTPVRNFDEDNSCDAKQGFDNNDDVKKEASDVPVNPSSFRFTIESSNDYKNGSAYKESPKKEETTLQYKFESQIKINAENTADEESSNSNNLHIDYESDSNNKTDVKIEIEQSSEDSKKDKVDEKKGHKSSYHSKDRHSSSSKDRKYDSKHSSRDKQESRSKDKGKSRDDNKTRDDHKSKSHKDSSSDKKDRDSSKYRHSSSHRSSSSHKDSKTKSSSSSQKSSSRSDDKKPREKSSESKREHKSSSYSKSSKSDKDRKGSSSSSRNKDEKKKDKKVDDHYSLSGRGNTNRRSTDRDSNDGNSSSSKGFNNQSSKTTDNKASKGSSSKSENTPTSSDGTYPSDKDSIVEAKDATQKPIRVETHLETPISMSTSLKLPEMVLKKPRIASNFEEAKEMMKMRKFLDEEQRRMNQEAALLLEFHANVRPNLSQVYSNISGPELEFVCLKEASPNKIMVIEADTENTGTETKQDSNAPETNKMIQDFLNNTTNEDVEEMDNTDESQIGDESDDLESHLKSYSISRSEPQNVTETAPVMRSDSKRSDNISMKPELKSKSEAMQAKSEEIAKDFTPESPEEPNEIDIPIHICGVKDVSIDNNEENMTKKHKETEFICFGEQDKYNAEIEKDKFAKFFRKYKKTFNSRKKLFAINCSEYALDLLKDLTKNASDCEIVNYHKNGHSKLDDKKPKLIKNIDVKNEIILPIKQAETSNINPVTKSTAIQSPIPSKTVIRPQILSPVKSECSFELSSDYDAKLDEIMNTKSRQQIMEIILGGVISEETPEVMQIDICNESNIEIERPGKRSYEDMAPNEDSLEVDEERVNNNTVLASKLRKTSESEEISSTTDTELVNQSVNQMKIMKSKYLGKARRVGLPKPKKSNPSNSPSSDKSVENYEQNTTQGNVNLINCRIKSTIPRNKVQRYDPADLYKPKLHYLSKRNNINTN